MFLYIAKTRTPRSQGLTDLHIGTCDEGNVYLCEDDGGSMPIDYENPEVTGTNIMPVPILKSGQIFSAYISGASGSGKSTIAAHLVKGIIDQAAVQRMAKPAAIFLVSQSPDAIKDPAYAELRKMKRQVAGKSQPMLVALDITEPELYELDITIWRQSIFVFDDIEGITDKTLRDAVLGLQTLVLTTGRKHDVHCISILHKTKSHKQSAMALTESRAKVIFPRLNRNNATQFLATNMGMNNRQIAEVVSKTPRYLFIHDTVPAFWMSSTHVRLL